jgi:CubicO group peptidase (beta-lactamase class C family)
MYIFAPVKKEAGLLRSLKRYLILFLIALLPHGITECSRIAEWGKPDPFPTESQFTDLDKIIIRKKSAILDSILNNLAQKQRFNGCVLYAEKGRLVYKRAYGLADFRTKERLTTSSSFQLASVSKMFTAMAIMMLKEKGDLKYDDPAGKYIKGFPYPDVTIRQLLNHRSGLPEYMHMTDENWNQEVPFTNDDLINLLRTKNAPSNFAPDNGFDYCNTNYALLASIVEEVSGKDFASFIQEHIFQPLGMSHSYIYCSGRDSLLPQYVDAIVQGHKSRRVPRVEPNHCQNGVVGDKGVYASIEDLYKWDQALYHEKLVSNQTLQEAFTGGSPRSYRRVYNYGFGWRIKEDRDSTVFHYGWWKGFRSFFIRDMVQEKTIIVLTNLDRTVSSDQWWSIIDDHRFELGYISEYPQRKAKGRH